MATNLGKVGMVMKGTWSSGSAYEVLDAVSYNGGLYVAKQASPAGTLPTNTTYWQAAISASDISDYYIRKQTVATSDNIPTTTEISSVTYPNGISAVDFKNGSYVSATLLFSRINASYGAGLMFSFYGGSLWYVKNNNGTWTMTAITIP